MCIKTIGSTCMVNGWHWKEKWSETDQEDWTTLIYGEERKLIIKKQNKKN